MKLFFAYLRQRWKVLLGAVLFYALFAVSFALYGLPLAAVWYPAALTAVLGLIFFLWDACGALGALQCLSRTDRPAAGDITDSGRRLSGDHPQPASAGAAAGLVRRGARARGE